MPRLTPKPPLPPRLRSTVAGTWAYKTMSCRIREDIIARVFRENDFLPDIVQRIEALDEELAHSETSVLSYLEDDGGGDIEVWNEQLKEAVEARETWLSAPWCLAEFYLYRRLMTAINYFQLRVDPFEMQKQLGLTTAIDSISMLAVRVNTMLSSTATKVQQITNLQGFVLTALWGNRMDLSIWPVGGADSSEEQSSGERAAESFANVLEQGQKMILTNHISALCDYVSGLGACRMDIIVDNAGFELFCDLCLADFLVCSGLASSVYIQLKSHPTYVSDAMEKDVMHTIHFLQSWSGKDGSETATGILGNRWANHVTNKKWILTEHSFWVQPQAMWDMPQPLRSDISQSALVFVKGDANYRRLLGDRSWALDTPFEDIVGYFPTPVCALRTLKAELGCGMAREATERLALEDEQWMVAGKYGVVHFCDTTKLF